MQKKIKLKEQASAFACHQPARKAGGSGGAGEDLLPRTACGAAFTGVTRSICIIGCGPTTSKNFNEIKRFEQHFSSTFLVPNEPQPQ
jgi:hypothetical protein